MKEMLTLGLTIILGLILLYIGFYLFTHRTKKLFGVFSPKDDPALKKAMTLWAYILTFLGALTIIVAFIGILAFQITMLILDAILVFIMSILMPTYLRMP
ncbi:MAG: hypothetical protein K2L20_06405 [Ligilactobacillus sp.]|nr:hypothetical protein [Ligilactobacillus sp.]